MAIRRRLAHPRFGADHGLRWRGGKISRLEGLSDAVFAFAVCFGILFWVWYKHYRFFRRYGLADGITTALTGVLLFIVLFYVYPMKFLFTMLFNQFFGEAPADVIRPSQAPELMLIYGAGFIAVQLVFVLLYLRAYHLAGALELDAHERLATRSEAQAFALNALVGLASIAIVTIGGPDASFWSGMAYMLIWHADLASPGPQRPHHGHPHPPGRRPAALGAPIDVGPMTDRQDQDPPATLIDAVHHPVVAAVGAVGAFELEPERPPHPGRVGGQGAVDELDGGGGRLLGQAAQGTPGRCRPVDLERFAGPAGHRSVSASASCIDSRTVLPSATSASASRMAAVSSGSLSTARVSSRDSRSSRLSMIAAGWPCLVITTRPCSRSRRSTTSERRFFTSARGTCSAGVMDRSMASFGVARNLTSS
jgi:hypothetical protein